MQVFVRVVDTGSFTRAAESLQMPKATVSMLVSAIESELTVRLLHRTTRQLNLTADGAAYYERCLAILAEIQDMEDTLSRRKTRPGGRLRVDVGSGVGNNLIVPSLPDFLLRYPDIDLHIGCSDRRIDLVEESVECVIRAGTPPDSTLVARQIGAAAFLFCATPAYLERKGRPLHPDELANHDCIRIFASQSGKIYDWEFEQDGKRIEMQVPGRVAVNDSSAYLNATLSGLGIGQLPAYSAMPHVRAGTLELVLPDWSTDSLPIHAVYLQNRHLSAKVRVFIDWVAELLAADPYLRHSPRGMQT